METPVIEKPDLCIYHAPCTDGFGAAFACFLRWGHEVRYERGDHSHGKDDEAHWLSLCAGKRVVCFDFSFSRELTEKIHTVAKSFQVIDHHGSAKDKLGDLPYCHFDLSKSGAMLAWEACFPGERPPRMLIYVQDQDLWQWKEPCAKEICTYINAAPFSFYEWNKIYEELEEPRGFSEASDAGHWMIKARDNICHNIARLSEEWSILGNIIVAVNCPSNLRTFVCDILRTQGEYGFVAAYGIDGGDVTWSLRSLADGQDVSEIATQFPGGGGHKAAAGFTVPISWVDFDECSLNIPLRYKIIQYLKRG
jgi:oligoribonuclease NrnB/cAMP/cGMP phosphodiesterase (DHH superfamily)